MRLIKNSASDRVIDELRQCLQPKSSFDIATPAFSLFAFAELHDRLADVSKARLAVPSPEHSDWKILGDESDRAFRNRLQSHWFAKQCSKWVSEKVEVRSVAGGLPQATMVVRSDEGEPGRVITGSSSFTTSGLGLTPNHQFSLIQSAENAEECSLLASWFDGLWTSCPQKKMPRQLCLSVCKNYLHIGSHRSSII